MCTSAVGSEDAASVSAVVADGGKAADRGDQQALPLFHAVGDGENVAGFLENSELKQITANVVNPINEAACDADERGENKVEGLFAQAEPISNDEGPLPMPAKEAARAGLNLLPAL